MDWDDALPWSLLLTLGAIALALRSMVVQRRLRARIDALTDKLAMLDHRVFRINERLEAGGQGLAPSPDAPPAVEVTPEQTSEPVASEPIAPEQRELFRRGQSHPAVFIIGTVGGQYGFFRSDDGGGASWKRINDNAHQFGWLQGNYIGGDENVFGHGSLRLAWRERRR